MKPVWDEKEKKQSSFKDLIIDADEYTGKIKKVEWINSPYSITEYNQEGLCLSVWIDIPYDGQTKRIFDKISVTSPTKLNELRQAVGLQPVPKGEDFEESEILGREVQLEVDRYTSKAGKVSNIVKRYVKQEPVVSKANTSKKVSNTKSVPWEHNDDEGVGF
jgi:hypothetical protein